MGAGIRMMLIACCRTPHRILCLQDSSHRSSCIPACPGGHRSCCRTSPCPAGLPHLGADSLSRIDLAGEYLGLLGLLLDVLLHLLGSGRRDLHCLAWRVISARACASSFQSLSQTYLWQRGQRLKWPLASLLACSKTCSCSLMPLWGHP